MLERLKKANCWIDKHWSDSPAQTPIHLPQTDQNNNEEGDDDDNDDDDNDDVAGGDYGVLVMTMVLTDDCSSKQ